MNEKGNFTPEKPDPFKKIEEAIFTASTEIEAEFARTDNSWINCFDSMVAVIDLYLESPNIKESSPDEYERLRKKLDAVKKRSEEVREHYPERKTIPPKGIQKELLDSLNVLK